MNQIMGLIPLAEPILCKKEVLGEKFNTKIEGRDVTFIMPSFDESKDGSVGMEHMLISPNYFSTFKEGNSNLVWGCVIGWPNGLSSVQMIAIEINLKEDDFDENAQKIYRIAKNWGDLIRYYACLITKQNCLTSFGSASSYGFVNLFNKKTKERISTTSTHNITINIPAASEYLSMENMKLIIEMLSSNKKIKTEYHFLLKAYSDLKNHELRQTIVDATTSLEICLDNYIMKTCDAKEIDGTKLLDHRSLGDKFRVLKILKIELPTKDPDKKIVKFRNDIVHNRNLEPSTKDVGILLEHVNKYLKEFSPDFLE